MIKLSIAIAMLPAFFARAAAASVTTGTTSLGFSEAQARRNLDEHYYQESHHTFEADGHICYKSGCEKYDTHLHHWVKDPHCCAYTNGYQGEEWARCSAGTFRSILRNFDYEYLFKGQLHVGHQCLDTSFVHVGVGDGGDGDGGGAAVVRGEFSGLTCCVLEEIERTPPPSPHTRTHKSS